MIICIIKVLYIHIYPLIIFFCINLPFFYAMGLPSFFRTHISPVSFYSPLIPPLSVHKLWSFFTIPVSVFFHVVYSNLKI